MTRSFVTRISLALAILASTHIHGDIARAQGGRSMLDRAREQAARGQVDEAESTLSRVIEYGGEDVAQEAMFVMAGLKPDAEDADRWYQRIIDDDPRSEWAVKSFVERAKLQYALGHYESAYRTLRDSGACETSEEACLFLGLSAIMLKRYEDARTPLERVRRGKLRTWAYLALAEADMAAGKRAEACRRYEALSSALISPTALYRHAECLENVGETDEAMDEFKQVVENFRDTPEAVSATEKLQLLRETPQPAAPVPAPAAHKEGVEKLERGYTLQFGSFRDRGNAIKLAAKIKRVYPAVRVDSELINFREYHRVRYGYFATRDEAVAKGNEIANQMGEDFTIMTLP